MSQSSSRDKTGNHVRSSGLGSPVHGVDKDVAWRDGKGLVSHRIAKTQEKMMCDMEACMMRLVDDWLRGDDES